MSSERAEIAAMIAFFTRLPAGLTGVPATRLAEIDLAQASRFAGVAGALIGLIGALAIWALDMVGLPREAAVIAGMVVLLILTGGLHEDGFADMADSFGARTPERRLEIMRDSRVGTYGAIALWVSLSLRAVLLIAIAKVGGMALLGALIAAHVLSRSAALYLPYDLPPARPDGASAAFGRPDWPTFRQGLLIAGVIGAVAIWLAAGIAAVLLAFVLTAVAAYSMSHIAWTRYGGQTGDLIGAAQQIAEMAILAAIAIFI